MKAIFFATILAASPLLPGLATLHARSDAVPDGGDGPTGTKAFDALTGALQAAGNRRAVLLDPNDREWSTEAPESFRARFVTSKGEFAVEVHREWAPLGADRFYNLVRLGFYDDSRVYRIREGVFAQFGLAGDPAVNAVWYERTIPDDPPGREHTRGRVFFAMRGPDDRTTQAVINLRDNPDYYEQGFVPFGEVVEGMNVVDNLYAGYGEDAGGGMRAGNQGRIVTEGNTHLDADFPLLDHIYRAVIE